MATYKTFKGRTLQDWYSIRIEREGESVEVVFCSRIHVNKENKCSFSFSHAFTDGEILRDDTLATWIYNRYGSDIFTDRG